MKTRKIRTALYNVLPGEKAHALMAPRPKYIEGIEGVHPCPPVNSAILALIVPFENELALPLIKRVNRGKYHGGQIAFPGGKMEKEDADALQTALRECHEEIGVPRRKSVYPGSIERYLYSFEQFQYYSDCRDNITIT